MPSTFQEIRQYLTKLEQCKNKDCDYVGKFSTNNKNQLKSMDIVLVVCQNFLLT